MIEVSTQTAIPKHTFSRLVQLLFPQSNQSFLLLIIIQLKYLCSIYQVLQVFASLFDICLTILLVIQICIVFCGLMLRFQFLIVKFAANVFVV